MRAVAAAKAIPILCLTDANNAGHQEQGLALGAADFICWPLDPSVVRTRVDTQVELLRYRSLLSQMLERPLDDVANPHQEVFELLRTLRASEQRFRDFMNYAPMAISLKDTQGRFQIVNRIVTEHSGFSEAELVGRSNFELARWQGTPTNHDILDQEREVLKSGNAVSVTRTEQHANGSLRTIKSVKFPVRDEDYEIVGIGSINADITEQQAAEEAIQSQQAELRRLASEVSLAEERERRRIAAELHDGAVQNLGLMRINAGLLYNKLTEREHRESMDELKRMIDVVVHEVRSLIGRTQSANAL